MNSGKGLKIRRVPLDALHLDAANSRSHNERNLGVIKGSLSRFGQAEPLVVHQGSGRVIGGNGRLVAMKELGWDECDVVELPMGELEATALGIALNRSAELATWDDDALGNLLTELQAEDALLGVGFDDAEIDALLDEIGSTSDLEDPGPGEPPTVPVSRPGDLWALEGHRLLCGDSTNAQDVARLMAGEKAALLATDPPYLVDYKGGNHPQSWANRPETRDKHWDDYVDPDQGLAFFQAFLETGLAHCIERAPVYQWHAHRRQSLVERAWEAAGLLVHQQIIWAKARPVLTRSHYMWSHEPCFYGWPKGKMPNKSARPSPNLRTVWEIDQVGQQDGIHPTQKPTRIFEIPIAEHTRPGAVVLESFSGSGTQIIAAEKLGRRCFAMELSAAFVDVAVIRWQQFTGKPATLDGSSATFDEIASAREGEADGES